MHVVEYHHNIFNDDVIGTKEEEVNKVIPHIYAFKSKSIFLEKSNNKYIDIKTMVLNI